MQTGESIFQAPLRLRRRVKQDNFDTERDEKEFISSGQDACEIAHATLHIRNDVHHASAGIEEDSDGRVDLVLLFEDLNVLRLIVVVKSEIFLRKVGDEVAVVVFDCCKDIDQIDIDFKRLRVRYGG